MRSFCSAPQKPTRPPNTHKPHQCFLQVMAQGGRKSGSVASYMGLVPGREEENRGQRGGLFDLLAASVLDAEWSRWAPITSPPGAPSHPPTGHTHEYNRWWWIGLWLCFQGVVFEVNGSIRLCFPPVIFWPRANTSKNVFLLRRVLWKIWPTTFPFSYICIFPFCLIFNLHFMF